MSTCAAGSLYCYAPSTAAALFCIFFAVAITAGHVYISVKDRFQPTTIFLSLAGIFTTSAFIARTVGSFYPSNTHAFAADCIFTLLITPTLATVLHLSLQTAVYRSASASITKESNVLIILVFFTPFAIILSTVGGAVYATKNTSDQVYTGNILITVALMAQLASFGLLTIIATIFYFLFYAGLRSEKSAAQNVQGIVVALRVIFTTTLLLVAKIMYRVCWQNSWSPWVQHHIRALPTIWTDEVFFYVFEVIPVFIVLITFLLWPAERCIAEEWEGCTAWVVWDMLRSTVVAKGRRKDGDGKWNEIADDRGDAFGDHMRTTATTSRLDSHTIV